MTKPGLSARDRIHLPDSIRGGANPTTMTVGEILTSAAKYRSWAIWEMKDDIRRRCGVDLYGKDLESSEVLSLLTLGDIRALTDDPNATLIEEGTK